MKIIHILAHVRPCLYAVQYEGEELDEFRRLVEKWTDVFEMRSFFEKNKKMITNGFFGSYSVNEAATRTIESAENLETILRTAAKAGQINMTESLQTLFKALDDNEYRFSIHQKSKAKGTEYKSWLRLYGIRLGPNTFVITGGGIKLTKNMKDSPDLDKELSKLEFTKNYLMSLGIIDENDYEFLEM